MKLRDHVYRGMTQSLCPECLSVIPAKIITRGSRVYFRKRCPEHGVREDFVCSDYSWFDRVELSVPGKLPLQFGTDPVRGCPFDCGLCTEHEQHTCIGLLEITAHCNLECPICFAASGPGGAHLPREACEFAIDRLVAVEGRPEVLQLSGGEPTIHPEFLAILEYACAKPIDVVMINTNGIRFARDARFLAEVAKWRHRVELYFQFDGFHDDVNQRLRGESLLATKLQALERLAEAGMNVTLVCTLQSGVNEDQVGDLVRFALGRPFITGLSFQPTTYTGRYFLPEHLENRITFPDVIQAVARQAGDIFQEDDFLPLPCAHPNGHSLAYAYRSTQGAIPLNRFIDIPANMDLLANGITFNRERAKALIDQYLQRSCGSSDCDHLQLGIQRNSAIATDRSQGSVAEEFFARAIDQRLNPSDVLRITVTSFMDAYNFDVRQVMKSCVHHLLPSGHIIPFSAYNVLYRDGHVPLPPLNRMSPLKETWMESACDDAS